MQLGFLAICLGQFAEMLTTGKKIRPPTEC